VHDQLVVHKVEAGGASLEGVLDHLGEGFRVEPRKLVDVFARVLAVRDAEPEVEVEGLEVLVAKKVALDHPKILRKENHIVMHLSVIIFV